MRVLVACEYSGTVRDAFLELGHDAYSCDILPTESNPERHYQCDIFDVIDKGWDLLIAHPPCTYLCNSGVCWLYKKIPSGKGWPNPVKFTKEKNEERWELMREGAEFFKRLFESNIPKIAVENPIMHKYAKEIIGCKQSQVVQPWMFGHKEQKATCLWLKNLPLLKETDNVKEEMLKLTKEERQRLHYLPPSKDRWKIRSKTFEGIAKAMAEQWGIE